MSLGTKEALSSEARKLLGLFHATEDPGKLTQKAHKILALTKELGKAPKPSGAFFSKAYLIEGLAPVENSFSIKVQIDG